MKAAVLHRYGSPEYGEFTAPDRDEYPDSTLVKVHAATLNAIDRITAAGQHYLSPRTFPVVAGIEGAGVTSDGRRVYFGRPISPYGSMAERTVVPAGFAMPIPENVDFATAATLGNAGMAALMPLSERGSLVAGESVVVLGGTGVVGRLAVQAARLLGAGAITVVGRDQDALDATIALGATATVTSAGLGLEELSAVVKRVSGGADVIVDYTWGDPALAALRAGNEGVRLVQVGDRASAEISLPAQLLRSVGASISGFMPVQCGPQAMARAYRQLIAWAATGDLNVEYELVPLSAVAAAWERAATARHKLVLVP